MFLEAKKQDDVEEHQRRIKNRVRSHAEISGRQGRSGPSAALRAQRCGVKARSSEELERENTIVGRHPFYVMVLFAEVVAAHIAQGRVSGVHLARTSEPKGFSSPAKGDIKAPRYERTKKCSI